MSSIRLSFMMGLVSLGFVWTAGAAPVGIPNNNQCENSQLYMTVDNLGPDGKNVVLSNGEPTSVTVGSEGSAKISLNAADHRKEYQVQAFLTAEDDDTPAGKADCTSWVELPSGCPPSGAAAHVTLYKTDQGYSCIIRSVAHLSRYASDALAMGAVTDKVH